MKARKSDSRDVVRSQDRCWSTIRFVVTVRPGLLPVCHVADNGVAEPTLRAPKRDTFRLPVPGAAQKTGDDAPNNGDTVAGEVPLGMAEGPH